MSRKRDVSLQNRYQYFVSDYDLKQYVKTFFEKPAVFFFFRTHSRFFLGRSQGGATRGMGLSKLQHFLPSHLEDLTLKYKRLNMFRTWHEV